MKRLLALEYVIALGIVSWSAIKGDGKTRYWPWPPTIVLSSVAFGLLGLLAIPQPKLAGTLGAGFLLAQLTRTLDTSKKFSLSGIPGSEAFRIYGEQLPNGQYVRILTLDYSASPRTVSGGLSGGGGGSW